MAAESAEEAEDARAQFRQSLTTDSSPRDLLKAIHKTLKSESNVRDGG